MEITLWGQSFTLRIEIKTLVFIDLNSIVEVIYTYN
jgi:hypothetical protein